MAVNVEEFLPEIEKIARVISSDFPDVDWEDVRQELCLFVLTTPALTIEGSGWSARHILSRQAYNYCKKQRSEQLYLSAQYSYRPSDVKKLLESGMIKIPEDSISELSEMDKSDAKVDVLDAIMKLSLEHRWALYRRYSLGEIPENASYERKKLNSAVKDLAYIMNTYHAVRRSAMTNSKANAIISNGW